MSDVDARVYVLCLVLAIADGPLLVSLSERNERLALMLTPVVLVGLIGLLIFGSAAVL